jgi:hypothetical protein
MKKLSNLEMLNCVGGADIPGITLNLVVGLNAPSGDTKMITAPSSAETGAANAFSRVKDQNGVEIANIDVLVIPDWT